MKRTIGFGTLIAAMLLVLACAAGPPPQEIAEARLAIQDAKNANADRRAPRPYDAAVAHLNVAQNAWNEKKDFASASHWARLAEAEAREAQYRAEAQAAEETLRRETERRSRAELAVRDAEIALLQARARTEAERRAAEAEVKAAEQRRQAQEELARREAQLAAERQRAEDEAAQRTQEEKDRMAAELEKMRLELEETRKAAEEAQRAAEEERRRVEEQRQSQARAEEEMRKTLSQLAQVREEARGLIVTLPGSIYFDVNKSDVKPAMRDRLSEIGRALSTVPDRSILVEGHTDSDGKDEYNLRLSELRAQSVRSILVGGGVSPDRVETRGYGETRPTAPNATAAGKAQNRRVEIVLQGTGATPPAP